MALSQDCKDKNIDKCTQKDKTSLTMKEQQNKKHIFSNSQILMDWFPLFQYSFLSKENSRFLNSQMKVNKMKKLSSYKILHIIVWQVLSLNYTAGANHPF